MPLNRADISIIIPFYNEEENVNRVLEEIFAVTPFAEIVAVDDGSTDKTRDLLETYPNVRLLKREKNMGKGFAVVEGLKAATHESCILIDGDCQYDPSDIPPLLEALENSDLVCGWRTDRQDRQSSLIVSHISNSLRRFILKDGIKDTACGIKAIRKSHANKHLVPFEGTHRFIGAFFVHAGLTVVEMPIKHRPRLFGKTKYTHYGRAWRGIIDLFRVKHLIRKYHE